MQATIDKKTPDLTMVELENERYLKIANCDAMRPFLMSIVSDSNHWMFVASNGGLTAGRKNPEHALFPYYTDDKIVDSADITGSKTIIQTSQAGGNMAIWEPFSERYTEQYDISRNLYKSVYGNKVIFEEINMTLGLSFRYQWNTSKAFGFVRKAVLHNHSARTLQVNLLDGIQNIMPWGVPSALQATTSNLVDAYKRSELEPASGIGIFALSAIIVDKAEPSEALKANVAWHIGLGRVNHLLSSGQLDKFRKKQPIQSERDIKGERGAYFISTEIALAPGAQKTWSIVANVNQSQAQVIALRQLILDGGPLEEQIQADIARGTQHLVQLVTGADGLQFSSDVLSDARHYSNVLFNIMRGGVFDCHYQIEKKDFVRYLQQANNQVATRNSALIGSLRDEFSLFTLKQTLEKTGDPDLIRLGTEYLPLKFSRRHGDPSRPWNYFSINTEHEADGSKVLDYEGNWRDIFQNWEALACAYPEFLEGMIFRFLNASTFDGYNPYRVTKGGFDWETIEPDNPWSYIGYWGDHQIIYLQKLLELLEKHHPSRLQALLGQECFVYAAVPYIIKPYAELLKNPQDTIEFDHQWDASIRRRRDILGADGALLATADDEIYHVNFLEKILATTLAKISNFLPEAGIWMNTQRPEWNDANNALVGNGASVVTLCYLRRFLKFFQGIFEKAHTESVSVSGELLAFFLSVRETLLGYSHLLSGSIGDQNRKTIADRLGAAASDYRQRIYRRGFEGQKKAVRMTELQSFINVCLDFAEHSIRANQRADKLYHAYNLAAIGENSISCTHLDEMLEGQVAVLSAGQLRSEEALEVLDALRRSALFRPDQRSYLLYPNKELPGFLQKNTLSPADAQTSELLKKMLADGDSRLVERDVLGGIHFNGNFKNAKDLGAALDALSEGEYRDLAVRERDLILGIFENVFHHKAFTGRSGAFFSYEGLGSIYWHMVSKLLLAVQECCLKAVEEGAAPEVTERLIHHFYEIEAGIGVHKPVEVYGAFPTDPYSHTPVHRGAQQPGMTGQVKEDILANLGKLGVVVKDGKLSFKPCLLRKEAFVQTARTIDYVDIKGLNAQIALEAGTLCFTYCQIPIVYQIAKETGLEVVFADGRKIVSEASELDEATSRLVFQRTGAIARIRVSIDHATLRD